MYANRYLGMGICRTHNQYCTTCNRRRYGNCDETARKKSTIMLSPKALNESVMMLHHLKSADETLNELLRLAEENGIPSSDLVDAHTSLIIFGKRFYKYIREE